MNTAQNTSTRIETVRPGQRPSRLLLGVATAIAAVAASARAQCTLAGSGAANDAYLVATYDDLRQVGSLCGLNAVYQQTDTIDATISSSDTAAFVPIGTDADSMQPFTGSYHGGGFPIRNLFVRDTSNLHVGLFGWIARGTIDGVTLYNARISGSINNVGGVVGYNQGTVSDCYVTGTISGSRSGYIGGVVGENAGTVAKSHSFGRIGADSGSYVGGVVAVNDSAGVVTECYSSATVASTTIGAAVGGVVGSNYPTATVEKCYSTGTVTGAEFGSLGGVVGENAGYVDSCHMSGIGVSGAADTRAGGIVGVSDSGAFVRNSHSSVPVSGGARSYLGGVVGDNGGDVKNCYSTDSVSSITTGGAVGGVVGRAQSSSLVWFSYAKGRLIAGESSSLGGVVGENFGKVHNCYATDTLAARSLSAVGGVVGTSNFGAEVIDCYAIGRVLGASGSFLGGVVGDNYGSLFTSYAVGTLILTTDATVGGVVGQNSLGGNIQYSYWNSQISALTLGIGNIAGGLGTPDKMNSEMMRDSFNFTGFDFSNNGSWAINQGSSYPYLRGIQNAPVVDVRKRTSYASIPKMRQLGRTVELDLPSAAKVTVVDAAGRGIEEPVEMLAGHRVLVLPPSRSVLFVLVRTAGQSLSLPVQPAK